MMEVDKYFELKETIKNIGFDKELEFIENCLAHPCNDHNEFATEYIWVVLNAGMKYQVAVRIFSKIIEGLHHNIPVEYIFNHKSKVSGINHVYERRESIFAQYTSADDKITYLESLPWIGSITKYHLARNLGLNVCKPDRHLVRIANKYKTEPHILCDELSSSSGDLVGVVDFVLWSCGNQRLL